MEEIPTMIPVVAVALIDSNGLVLMQRRQAGKAHGGLWEFPGGKLERGESPQNAAIREIAEELELDLQKGDLEPLTFASLPGEAHVILLYTCRVWMGDPVCRAADELGWFAPQALAGLAMPPLDVPLAKAIAGVK
jgi:8-oxo-dGTP diphosphatase